MRHRWLRMMIGTPSMASGRQTMLQRYLDGEIDEVTARRVAVHLEACRRCGLESATYTEIKRAVSTRSRAVPAEALQRLRAFATELADGGSATGAGGR